MSTKYPGGFITKSPPLPSASAARGIWTLDQAMQLKRQGLWPEPPPTVIGQPFGGGFFAGQISTTANSVATHNLVIAPLSTGQSALAWKNAQTATPGADSVINGPQNTTDMVADGSATVYPCAHFCNNLVTGGFDDWYMPARNELEVCYFNLKPGTQTNSATGINPNSVPARASDYTPGNPAQTSALAFRTGSTEPFVTDNYWTSTEGSATTAGRISFYNGGQANIYKTFTFFNVRAVRRVPV